MTDKIDVEVNIGNFGYDDEEDDIPSQPVLVPNGSGQLKSQQEANG
jgi:hypothetical protein